MEHDFHPNKTLGQNFLVDKNILEAIVDAGLDGVDEGVAVLEIGPGLGVMTQELLRRGRDVVAIEKDSFLAEGLAERVGPCNGALEVVCADALDIVAGGASETLPRIMVSNLPYQAGTRILLELVQTRRMERMTALLQTEVAQRLAAPEGSRERGLAGVWAQLDYDVEIVRSVPATCFWPRPEIGSSVVRLVRHERASGLTDGERAAFRRLTKLAFAHRRKQLGTIFRGIMPHMDSQEIAPGVDKTLRPERLSAENWISLAKGAKENENT